MADEEKRVHEDAERLTQPDWLKDVDSGQGDRSSSVRAEISNAMVGLMKDFYGKGPTKAKTLAIPRGIESDTNSSVLYCSLG